MEGHRDSGPETTEEIAMNPNDTLRLVLDRQAALRREVRLSAVVSAQRSQRRARRIAIDGDDVRPNHEVPPLSLR